MKAIKQADLLTALLEVSDEETQAMFVRLVAARRRQRECGHRDGWRLLGMHAVCSSCGLIALTSEHDALIRWPDPVAAEPDDALGTALSEWVRP